MPPVCAKHGRPVQYPPKFVGPWRLRLTCAKSLHLVCACGTVEVGYQVQTLHNGKKPKR